ncbi:MAG: serine--tRNA ligase [Candidatus Zixiibacteriota bacterium]|nr:MAG: serine--tRNA ligase [candidate division Zixibacteria bacterium]
MLDLKFIRENPELVKAGLKKKFDNIDVDRILELDERRREIIRQVEALKAERNQASGEIAKAKKAGKPADEAIASMRRVGEDISRLDEELREKEEQIRELVIWIPNLPHESVPVGADESAAVVVREWGEIPKPDFEVLPHWEIGEKLGILDLPAAAKISGSGFYLLKGAGARLQRALINYMLDVHTADGYEEISPPFIVNEGAMFGTGQIPKMAEDMYRTENDNLYLVPTGEVPVTNICREEIISYKDLPMNMVCYTPCFRREAGAAGKDTRGMIRVHQFDKVELVKIVRPEKSYEELETLTQQAEKILQGLKIPYRVCTLASGDLSFAAAKCYDIELWACGVAKYLEISSISNFEDFQARRMDCRFRDEDTKVKFPHTLNGSGVALARLIPAILENFQNPDGSVTVPEVLRPYMGGAEKIG